MYCLYLRPSEGLRLRMKDVIAPVQGKGSCYRWWSFVLHPIELGVPSKTQEFDETLVLDQDARTWAKPSTLAALAAAISQFSSAVGDNSCLASENSNNSNKLNLRACCASHDPRSDEKMSQSSVLLTWLKKLAARPSGQRTAKERRKNGERTASCCSCPATGRAVELPCACRDFFGRTFGEGAKDNNYNNWPVLWDISGEQYALRKRSNRWMISGRMRAGLVRAGHVGTPCHSFSRARDRRPGPPPLRSDACVMGLPNLRAAEEQSS